MRKFNFIIIFLLGLFSLHCKSTKDVRNSDEIASAIKGEWKIDHEVCCGRNAKTTYGGNKSIHFNTKKSTYTIYDGDKIEQQGNYTLESQEMGTMIKLKEGYPAIIRITEGKLFIDWSYMDLRREVYKR